MIQIKSKKEIEIMKEAGKILSSILSQVSEKAQAGVTLIELDEMAEKLTLAADCKPAFKGYKGYRHTLCTSVNEQVIHGIPTDRALKNGDVVGLDFGLIYQGYYSDSAVTVPIGNVSPEAMQLLKSTRDALYAAIDECRPGKSLKDIASAIESTVKPHRYGIVREFVGHGIGRSLHEDPQVPNYVDGATALKLKAGMTICIEPMITQGSREVRVLKDKWTAVTVDGQLSAHFEHTLLITENDPEILTDWDKPRFSPVFERHGSLG